MVERDLSLLVDLGQPYAALRDAVAAALAGAPLQELKCVDVFRHKSLPQGRQAWLLRLRFQAAGPHPHRRGGGRLDDPSFDRRQVPRRRIAELEWE